MAAPTLVNSPVLPFRKIDITNLLSPFIIELRLCATARKGQIESSNNFLRAKLDSLYSKMYNIWKYNRLTNIKHLLKNKNLRPDQEIKRDHTNKIN